MTGGAGTQALYTFYNDHFIPKMPADTELTPVDRIFGANTVVDHFVFKFTHNTEMDWMLPGAGARWGCWECWGARGPPPPAAAHTPPSLLAAAQAWLPRGAPSRSPLWSSSNSRATR